MSLAKNIKHPIKHQNKAQWMLFVLIATGLVQLLYLLIPGPFWDDWIYFILYQRGEKVNFLQAFIDNGRPLGGWILWQSMIWFGPLYGPRFVISLSVVGTAISIYSTLRIRDICKPSSAALIAISCCTTSAMQTVITSVMLQFYVGFFALYFGLYLFVASDTCQGYLKYFLKAIAIIISLLSVALAEAPLVLIPFYPIVLVIAQNHGNIDLVGLLKAWREYFFYSLLLGMLGGIILLGTFYFFPATGDFKGAHDLSFNFHQLISNSWLYIKIFTYSYILIILYILVLYCYIGRPNLFQLLKNRLLLVGAFVLLLSITPYLLAGRVPLYLGWESRVFLFSGFGIGLLLLVISNFLTDALNSASRKRIIISISILLLINIAIQAPLWAERQVKDDLVRIILNKSKSNLSTGGIFWITDNNWNPTHYRAYEWTGLTQIALDRNNLVALPGDDRSTEAIRKWVDYLSNGSHLVNEPPDLSKSYEIQIEKLPLWWSIFSISALSYRIIASEKDYEIYIGPASRNYVSIK